MLAAEVLVTFSLTVALKYREILSGISVEARSLWQLLYVLKSGGVTYLIP